MKFLKKLWELINNPKYERLIIVAAPCLSVLIAALILAPGIKAASDHVRASRAETPPPVFAPAATEAPAVVVTPVPQATPSAAPVQELAKPVLRASSVERDLYITVYDEAGVPVTGQNFTLTVGYPGGIEGSFLTETDGSCYLTQLEAGEYTVSMAGQAGYAAAEPISCSVRGQLVYEQIEDIEEIVDVYDVAEIPEEEVKTQDEYAAPSEAVPEEILTPEEDEYADGVITEQHYVLDANGNLTYTYEFHTNEENYLYYRYSGEVSNVQLVDEGNNFYYGLYQDGDLATAISLFNPDNTPLEEYDITATPIVGYTERTAGWQEINGRIYYFDQDGARASSVGIDVSYYNGSINWQAVKAQGIDFAIIRVGGRTWSEGKLYDDYRTVEYFTQAKNAGLKVGAYFYSTAINAQEAVEEASVALNTLNGVSLDYPLFFDTEYSGIYPEARSDNLSITQRSEIIRAFCETVTNSSRYTAGVYSGEYFMKNCLDYSSFSQYTVWLASYTADNKLPDFGRRYDIWQFTDGGVIDGINGYVDMNVIF